MAWAVLPFHNDHNAHRKHGQGNHTNEYHGPKTSYYPNGNVKEKKEYLLGELHGKSIKYFEDGNIKEEANFKNDIQTGKATRYDKTGKKIKSEDYFNGKVYAQQIF